MEPMNKSEIFLLMCMREILIIRRLGNVQKGICYLPKSLEKQKR